MIFQHVLRKFKVSLLAWRNLVQAIASSIPHHLSWNWVSHTPLHHAKGMVMSDMQKNTPKKYRFLSSMPSTLVANNSRMTNVFDKLMVHMVSRSYHRGHKTLRWTPHHAFLLQAHISIYSSTLSVHGWYLTVDPYKWSSSHFCSIYTPYQKAQDIVGVDIWHLQYVFYFIVDSYHFTALALHPFLSHRRIPTKKTSRIVL